MKPHEMKLDSPSEAGGKGRESLRQKAAERRLARRKQNFSREATCIRGLDLEEFRGYWSDFGSQTVQDFPLLVGGEGWLALIVP